MRLANSVTAGTGERSPLPPQPHAAPPPPPALTRPHEVGPRAAELQLVGQRGQAAPRPPVPDLGQHLGHGVHALCHVLRADRGSARPGTSPHPGALGPYLQRGAAQKRAGVGHDMRYPRHAVPCPSPHPVAPRGARRERRCRSTSGLCGQVRAGSRDGGAAAGSGNAAAAGEAGEGRAARSGAVWRSVLAVAERREPLCSAPLRSALPAAAAGLQRGSRAGRPGALAVGRAGPGRGRGLGGKERRACGELRQRQRRLRRRRRGSTRSPGTPPALGGTAGPGAPGAGTAPRDCARSVRIPTPPGLGLSAALWLCRGAREAEGPGCPHAASP